MAVTKQEIKKTNKKERQALGEDMLLLLSLTGEEAQWKDSVLMGGCHWLVCGISEGCST